MPNYIIEIPANLVDSLITPSNNNYFTMNIYYFSAEILKMFNDNNIDVLQ